jgi:hypothetical protein
MSHGGKRAGAGRKPAFREEGWDQKMYHFECLCGRGIATPTRETVCPECGRQIVLEWGKDPVVLKDSERKEPKA